MRPSSNVSKGRGPNHERGRAALSTDDMVFEEIRYREPRKARRPDRDRRFACVAYEVPGTDDLPIFLDLQPADAIERHALRDTSVELGGYPAGAGVPRRPDGSAVRLDHPIFWKPSTTRTPRPALPTRMIRGKKSLASATGCIPTSISWAGIILTRTSGSSCPVTTCSSIHRNFFAQPLQLAYVVDPIRQTRGFFRWRDGGLDQVGGYYLSSDRNDPVALARLANDLESIPNAESVGGGLSLDWRPS